MSISWARASRIASSCPKDFDFQYFIFQDEGEYATMLTWQRVLDAIYNLPDSYLWNIYICWLWIVSMVNVLSWHVYDTSFGTFRGVPYTTLIDINYNITYAVYLMTKMYQDIIKMKKGELKLKWTYLVCCIIDLISYTHCMVFFVMDFEWHNLIQTLCYCLRWHRCVAYLVNLMKHYLEARVLITVLNLFNISIIVRVLAIAPFTWTSLDPMQLIANNKYDNPPTWLAANSSQYFLRASYYIDKLFIPIGPEINGVNFEQRSYIITAILFGRVCMLMIPIALLAFVTGLYISPAERFRERFSIITNEMKLTHVPEEMRQKVETFYKMYWHKQKAVSKTELLATFPPALITTVNTDVYFEIAQKSQILRDLSYQFLSEISKFMTTINYVPGDIILKRNAPRDSIIYITYGDVEMLTAEDDQTPILRFCRGTIINPCGGCVEVGSSVAHVTIRAATFCTAHVLKTKDLWKTAHKFGKYNGQSFILHSSFEEHFEKVKRHYSYRAHPEVKYKSSIALLKRNLMDLKTARSRDGRLLLGRMDMFLQIAGCYLMRNRKDTTLAEESDAICLHSAFPCIVQPSSSLLITWHCFVAILTVFVVIYLPYQNIYLKTPDSNLMFFDHMVTAIYATDIYLHLCTGAKIEEGVPITFTHTAMVQIKSYWFVLDVLATMPMFEFIEDGRYAGMNKLLKLPKVFRVLKSLEMVFMDHTNLIRLFSYTLLLLLMCFFVSCAQQWFACNMLKLCLLNEDNINRLYMDNSKLDNESVENRVTFHILWALHFMTFTNHNIRIARSWQYHLYIMCLLETCVYLNVLTYATYSAAVMANAAMRDAYMSCINNVKDFFIKNDLDPILRNRFITYLKLCWHTDKAYSITHAKTSIIFDLPVHVNQELLNLQRSKYISCIPFMKNVNAAMLKVVSSEAHLFYTSPNEILITTGDITNEIYVIKQGFCEVIDPKTKKAVSLLTAKGYFGILECLLRIPAYYTVRAVTHVQLFSISRDHLMKIIVLPGIRNAIRYARTQPEYEILQQRQEPFLEYKKPPKSPNRELFPVPRKHIRDTAFLLPFARLGFFAILRYVFPRFTIRPDGKYLRHYEWFRCLCALCAANFFPLYYSLILQWSWVYYLKWFFDVSAYYDILQRMLVGYFDDNGILVYHPASTSAHYIKGAFLLDLFACLPLEELDTMGDYFNEKLQATHSTGTSQVLMINRLMQLYRVPPTLDEFRKVIKRADILFIIKAVPFYLALIVVLASHLINSTVNKYQKVGGGFLYTYKVTNRSDSWLAKFESLVSYNATDAPWNLVITSLFCMTNDVTCTGAEFFQTNTNFIIMIMNAGIFIGTIFTTYCAVRVISSRCSVNEALATYRDSLSDLELFMKKEKIDKTLCTEVSQYFAYVWEKTGGTDCRTVLQLCDQISLRTDAILHVYGETFAKCPILYECEVSMLRILGRAVSGMFFRKGMVIIERDDVISDLFFVDTGTLDMRHPDDDKQVITQMPRGSVFGNLDNVWAQVCPNRFVACSNMHVLKINSRVFHSVIRDFPTVRILLNTYRPRNQNYIIGGPQVKGKIATVWKDRVNVAALKEQGGAKSLTYHSNVIQIYVIIISLSCVLGDIYNAGFQDNRRILIGILYSLDFCFLINIIIHYSMPYINEDEVDTKGAIDAAKKKYCSTEFRYDLLTCLPFELFSMFSSSPWLIFAYLRLNRFFRIVTVHSCLQRYHENLNVNVTISSIVEVFIRFVLYAHISACVWYHLGYLEDRNDPGTSWCYRKTGEDNCASNSYLTSFYYVISIITLCGQNDLIPKTLSEITFVTFFMIVALLMYLVFMGEFAHIIHYRSYRCFNYYSKYLELQQYLDSNRVSWNLKKMSKAYSLYLWREARGMQTPKFLLEAPQVLKEKIMSAVYMVHIAQHPIFSQCEPAFIRQLITCFKPYYYSEGFYVVKEGEMAGAMYFIHQGQVQELDEDMEEKLKVYEKYEHFGTLQGLHDDVAYNLSYKTIVRCQVLTLYLRDWKYLLNYYPISKEIIYPPKKPPPPPKVYTHTPTPKPAADDEDKVKKKFQITKDPDEVKQFTRDSKLQLQDQEGGAIFPQIEEAATENLGPAFTPGLEPTTKDSSPFPAVKLRSKAAKTSSTSAPDQPSSLKETPSSKAEETTVDFSQWPMDSRRRSTIREPFSLEVTKEEEEEEVKPDLTAGILSVPSTDFNIYQSKSAPRPTPSVHKSSESDEEPPPKVDYGRRKSMIHGVDREAVERELASIAARQSTGPADEDVELKETPDQKQSERETSEPHSLKSDVVHLAPPGERPSGETYASFKSDITRPEDKVASSKQPARSLSAEQEKDTKNATLSDIAERVSLTLEQEKPGHSKAKDILTEQNKRAREVLSKERRGEPSPNAEKRQRAGLMFDEPEKTAKEADDDESDTETASAIRAKAARAQSIWGVEDFIMEQEQKDEKTDKKGGKTGKKK